MNREEAFMLASGPGTLFLIIGITMTVIFGLDWYSLLIPFGAYMLYIDNLMRKVICGSE